VTKYSSAGQLEKERRLFRQRPIPVAHSSELGAAPAVIVRNVDGVSVLINRDAADGRVRAFKNSCRHRGVRLLREDCLRAKAFVCPYHGWTYSPHDGSLIHIPHRDAFPTCQVEQHSLVAVHAEERHGFLWISIDSTSPTPLAVVDHLGHDFDAEIASFGLQDHVIGSRVIEREQRGNWKMIMEAFLEGYHIRNLHRDSVYPFFLDARSVAHRAGPHVRTASARRTAKEHRPNDDDDDDDANIINDTLSPSFATSPLRNVVTLSYTIFPCTTLIAHPDWTSLVNVFPIAHDRFLWSHTQLLPHEPTSDDERAHYTRSFSLIDGRVFTNEDLLMCAEMQSGLDTGANTSLLFGQLETPAIWFHEALDQAIGATPKPE
jgi:glycine betaine catabolism A